MPDQEIQKDRWPRVEVAISGAGHPYLPAPSMRAERMTYIPLSELEAEKELHRDIRIRAEDRLERLNREQEAVAYWHERAETAEAQRDAEVDARVSAQQRAEAAEKESSRLREQVALKMDDRDRAVLLGELEAAEKTLKEATPPPLHGHNRTLADVRAWLRERRDHEVSGAPKNANTPAGGMTMGALETIDALNAYLNGDDDA